ncbi:leucine-rich repeat-containing protein 71 isoform X1 [Gasterosteus aculeatus]
MSKTDQAEASKDAGETTRPSTGHTPNEELPAGIFDGYQCSGNVETDFRELCGLLDMKNIPNVTCTTEGDEGLTEAPIGSKRCLQVQLENENPLSAQKMKVFGWKVDEPTSRVLLKMLPSLVKLQSLHFWRAGLTDQMVMSLMNTASLCSNLRDVKLEDNHLPEQSYHLLLSEDSLLTNLTLRNNRIGDEGARLIGLALSTTRSANNNLIYLNLAFNCIGDAGAAHIAQGLRFNRALLALSLCNNHIGDQGARHMAAILSEFALTHDEIVEKRKMLLERKQRSSVGIESDQPADQLSSVASSSSQSVGKGANQGKQKKEKKAPKEEKSNKKSSDIKVTPSKGGNSEKALNAQKPVEPVEPVEPLLDEPVHYRDGELFMSGNKALTSLNLAGNRITQRSLPLFLESLMMQGEGRRLLRLCLQRNCFPPGCECYVKIQKLMDLRDPLKRAPK